MPIAARFVLVDTERWFRIRAVGAPRDGDPRDGELHQSTREGATFAATQSRTDPTGLDDITHSGALTAFPLRGRTTFMAGSRLDACSAPVPPDAGSEPERLRTNGKRIRRSRTTRGTSWQVHEPCVKFELYFDA